MEKLEINHILVKNAKLKAVKFTESKLTKLIDDISQKQNEILKLKVVDQDSLRMVVQL